MITKEIIIEYQWKKEDKVVKVFFHFKNNNKHPFVTFNGYNPFPFFNVEEKLYTSLNVFSDWMKSQGYQKIRKTLTFFLMKSLNIIVNKIR